MSIRITQGLAANATKTNLRLTSSRFFEAQQRVATGKRIGTPSDAPGDVARLLALKRNAREIEQFGANAAEGKAFANSAASALQKVSELLGEAQEKAVAGLNDANPDRTAIASALEGILNEVTSLANARLGDRYLFGGTVTDRPPFTVERDGAGQIRSIYRGNDEVFSAEVGPGLTQALNVPGRDVFRLDDRDTTDFTGATGAAAGYGTDSGRGIDTLVVAHGTTTFAGGGLSAGTSSAAGDTIIGPAGSHALSVTYDPLTLTGALRLNGGTAVTFTNPQSDVRVEGPNGEIVFVDTTGITVNGTATVGLSATGSLSTDGGQSSVAIDFSTNQQVYDGFSGAVLNVDSSAIRKAGTETIHYSGTGDVFGVLESLAAGLRGLATATDRETAHEDVRQLLDALKGIHDRVLERLGVLGTSVNRLEAAEEHLGDLEVRVKELASGLEEVDISEAVTDMQNTQTAYQSALLVASRVNQTSLLNYL